MPGAARSSPKAATITRHDVGARFPLFARTVPGPMGHPRLGQSVGHCAHVDWPRANLLHLDDAIGLPLGRIWGRPTRHPGLLVHSQPGAMREEHVHEARQGFWG
jgi:hypothetical protein